MKDKKYSNVQENVSALVQIFNAIPSSLFSAAAELAVLRHPRQNRGDVPVRDTLSILYLERNPKKRVSPQGTSPLFSLEVRIGKAKSSMPLRHFSAHFIHHITLLWNELQF